MKLAFISGIGAALVLAPTIHALEAESTIRAALADITSRTESFPIIAEYEVCPPAALIASDRVHVTIPLMLGIDADAPSMIATDAAIRLEPPEIRTARVTAPNAFQEAHDAQRTLNAAEADALVTLLAAHSKRLADHFATDVGRAELQRIVAKAIASRLTTRLRAQDDRRVVEPIASPTAIESSSAVVKELCANSSIAMTSPDEFHADHFVARGAVPVDDESGSSASELREYLKNAAGKVIAYREVVATMSTPIGQFKLLNASSMAGTTGRSGEKILNGVFVPQGLMPWAAAFMRTGTDGKREAFCGGALIDPKWVVTAAHCRIVDGGEVVIGKVDLAQAREPTSTVKRVWRHIAFGKAARYDSDIALVELTSPVTATFATLGAAAPAVNTEVIVAGWGATEEGTRSVQRLSSVDLDVQPQATCELSYGSTNAAVTDNMFCASKAAERKDACQGDSGGGSFRTPKGNQFELVGVVSFGKGCATTGFPGVYTKIASFRTWLDEVRAGTGVQ